MTSHVRLWSLSWHHSQLGLHDTVPSSYTGGWPILDVELTNDMIITTFGIRLVNTLHVDHDMCNMTMWYNGRLWMLHFMWKEFDFCDPFARTMQLIILSQIKYSLVPPLHQKQHCWASFSLKRLPLFHWKDSLYFTEKTPSYRCKNPHYKPKTVWWPSQVYNGNPYTSKMVSSWWSETLDAMPQ